MEVLLGMPPDLGTSGFLLCLSRKKLDKVSKTVYVVILVVPCIFRDREVCRTRTVSRALPSVYQINFPADTGMPPTSSQHIGERSCNT